MDNLKDRSSDLRELVHELDDNNVSDIESLSESLLDYSSGSDDMFIPDSDFDSDDSRRPMVDVEDRWGLDQAAGIDYQMPPSPEAARLVEPVPNIPDLDDQPAGPLPSSGVWVRVYEEEPLNVESKFTVRQPGPRDCPLSHKPLDYFHLFLTEGQIGVITRETNFYAMRKLREKQSAGGLKQKSRLHSWHNTTVQEMKVFVAIILNMGLTRRKTMADYWSTDPLEFIAWYGKTMSLRRFQMLNTMLHLTSRKEIPKGQPGHDPWVKIRPFLDAVNCAFKRHYVPHQNLSLDESMIGMKNRCAFIQYMPNKRHARFGVKKFELVDSKTLYVVRVELYSGKDYLAEGQDPFTQKVVLNLLEKGGCLGKGYHVITDNFYTKLPLALRLLDNNTYLTGTINKNSKDLSKSALSTDLGAEQSVYFRRGPVLLVGYKQKPTRKPVYLISTAYHAQDQVIRSRGSGMEAIKPYIIDQYNKLMGGVDCKDKSLYHWSCSRHTMKYWKKIFFNLLDMCVSNAYAVYAHQSIPNTPMSRKKFILELIRDLASPSAPAPAFGPGGDVAGHQLEKMPGKKMRVCDVCTPKKRTSFWCPGCNVGVHKECFHKLEHYWRQLRRGKKRVAEEDSDSD